MKNEKLLHALDKVDERFITASSPENTKKTKNTKVNAWGKWGAMAACFCLLIGTVALALHLLPGSTPVTPDNNDFPIQSESDQSEESVHTEGPWNTWQVTFNTVTGVLDASRRYIPGYFTEELSENEMKVLEPGMRMEYMQYSGSAGFDGEGNLIDVCLNVTTSIPGNDVSILISESGAARDYVMDMVEPAISVCEKVEYTVYQWDNGNGQVTLAADAKINGYSYAFTLQTSTQDAEQAKHDFTRILECFAYYEDGQPDLSAVIADEIPEWIDKTLSHQEALEDHKFGAFMLREVPSGFVAESIRRYKDQTADYLSGLWTSEYDELQWKVYELSDTDEDRLTSVADIENYDLSLYPIPRADSVPDELREIVDNPIFTAEELSMDAVWARAYTTGEAGDSNGCRMAFSVRYGDNIVEIRAKGIDPEWMYQQLINLIPE